MDVETYDKFSEVARDGFREQYESGDKLALIDCIRWCDRHDLSLPRWALVALSQAAGKYLDGVSENLHDAVFGAQKAVGRHANPRTARRDSVSHQLIFDVVTALKTHGYKGGRLYDRAQEILQEIRITPDKVLKYQDGDPRGSLDQDTIKKYYERQRNAGMKPTVFAGLMPDIVDMGDPSN